MGVLCTTRFMVRIEVGGQVFGEVKVRGDIMWLSIGAHYLMAEDGDKVLRGRVNRYVSEIRNDHWVLIS